MSKDNQVMGEMKMVKLASITPSPTNPRKTFEDDSIQELATSIREKGMISPVLLRPLGKDTYELVCGERRYRAAKLVQTSIKDRNQVPAVIRDMSDDEALELQITENLQRADVHPMQEAAAFQALVDNGHPAEELSNRLGKTVYFINQRLKLNSLTEAWQKAFYYDKVSLTDVLKVAQLPKDCQEDLYERQFDLDRDVKNEEPVKIGKWELDRYTGMLNNATFPLEDATIDSKVGACTGCQYNSATANLFADSGLIPTCSNLPCYTKKTDLYFNISLKEYAQEPGAILITSKYGETEKVGKTFKDTGLTVIDPSGYRSALNEPDNKVEFDEWKDDQYFDVETEEEIRQQYDEYCKEIDEEWKEYNAEAESGKYIKALVVDGREKGSYRYIQLKKGANTAAGNTTGPDTSIYDLQSEIDRIASKEKRNIELDEEKVFGRVKEALTGTEFWYQGTPLTHQEWMGGVIYLYGRLQWNTDDVKKKIFGKTYSHGSKDSLYDDLIKLPTEEVVAMFNKLLKYIVFEDFKGAYSTTSDRALGLTNIARAYIPEDIATFKLEQQEVALKRKDKVDKKLADLKAKKKALEAATKPKTEKKAAAGKGVKALLADAPDKSTAKKKK